MASGSMECSQARVEMTDCQAARRSERGRVDRLGSVIIRPWMYSMTWWRGGCVRWEGFVRRVARTYVESCSDD